MLSLTLLFRQRRRKSFTTLTQMTDMTFTHKIFNGPAEHIPAMNRVKKIIADANLV
jgi:hypothetical protein